MATATVSLVGRIPVSSRLLILVAKTALRARAGRVARWAVERISFEYRVGCGRWQRRPLGLTISEES